MADLSVAALLHLVVVGTDRNVLIRAGGSSAEHPQREVKSVMVAKILFFPVGNGDMTLMVLESGRKVLIDMNIRATADDPDDDTPDAAGELRSLLTRDVEGRLYIDALLISHPDQDHCAGLCNHFHLGSPEDWSKSADKIFIRELWSSPLVFRRASSQHTLCKDAKAFNTEARRRVARFRAASWSVSDGDRILILGEDEDGKTDDLGTDSGQGGYDLLHGEWPARPVNHCTPAGAAAEER